MTTKQVQGHLDINNMAPKPALPKVNSRRALGDIGNIVAEIGGKCNVKEGLLIEKNGQAITRPVTRSFGAQLLAQAAVNDKNAGVPQKLQEDVQPQPVVNCKVERKDEKLVWGNRQKRTNKCKDAVSATVVTVDSESDEEVVVLEAKPACTKNAPRVSKKVKPSTFTATLRKRSMAFCNDSDKHDEGLPNIDEGDADNQLAVVEYVEDIYRFYRKIERMSCVTDYMPHQTEVNERMRGILVDWLIEVHMKFDLMPETLYLTINLLDRYLSFNTVERKYLQLVGITSMLLASKYEEIWAPEINDLISAADNTYSREQILYMEKRMVNKLKFHLTVPTPYVFVVRCLKAAGANKEMEHLAFFLLEHSLTQYVMLKFTPSKLAAAAVYCARFTLQKAPVWDNVLERHSGFSDVEIRECASLMATFHQQSAGSKLKVIHQKYSDPHLNSVALLSPARLPPA